MASSSSNPTPPFHLNFDPNINSTPNTTFVQADPSNFRAVVQRLTGATKTPYDQHLPATGKPNSGDMGPHRPAFKLHERRQTARKLEIKLNDNNHNAVGTMNMNMNTSFEVSPSCVSRQQIMVSPVSTLEYFLGRGSPRTPMSPQEEEERAIAQKGFYLHPSPRGTPRGGGGGGGVDPPQLLPLFPLQSPRSSNNNSPPS